ncbi:MAG: Acetyltransferase (GNAT) family protein [candidate division BRC1 bacterium ADurb.BinA364]|nr:MAG: Acetyltransferase (GNAT) family protein [candidate division BRC1 bacterium ADurb.BinA364]
MIDIRIRPARDGDAAAIAEFQQAMAWETERLRLDGPTVLAGVKALLADPAKGRYWIAEIGGEIVGCSMTTPEWSDWRNGTVLWIQSVYVREANRRQGVYRAMHDFLKRMVESDASLFGIRLYVEKNNHVAQKAYAAMGMDGEHYRLFEWLK